MMAIKDRIEKESERYSKSMRDEGVIHDWTIPDDAFKSGANFALKAVIEMLKEKTIEIDRQFVLEINPMVKAQLAARISELNEVIHLLKS